MSKRFFVQSTDVVQKALQHIAIDLDTSAEKLAGAVLARFIEQAMRDPSVLRDMSPKPKK